MKIAAPPPDRAGRTMGVMISHAVVLLASVATAPAGPEVRANARPLAAPAAPPFFLYDHAVAPRDAMLIDRPYCTLVCDGVSRNVFICGYSGIDLPGGVFRKNATDSIHRYDLRDGRWHAVEQHDPAVGPRAELGQVVPNTYYPHHDPARNPPPHGWLNGADGGCVAGDHLYFAGKDNHRRVCRAAGHQGRRLPRGSVCARRMTGARVCPEGRSSTP